MQVLNDLYVAWQAEQIRGAILKLKLKCRKSSRKRQTECGV